MRRALLVLMAVLALLVLAAPVAAQQATAAEQLRSLAARAREGAEAAGQNKPDAARAAYAEIHETWETFEDQVRAQDATGYVDLETALDAVKDAVSAQTIDLNVAKTAFEKLGQEADQVAGRLAGTTQAGATSLSAQVIGLAARAKEGVEAVEGNKPDEARAEYAEIEQAWASFEDQVRVKDATGYADVESALDAVKDAVTAQTVDLSAAKAAFEKLALEANVVGGRLGGVPAANTALIEMALPDAVARLDAAYAAVERGDAAAAADELGTFVRAWPSIESVVATKSAGAYDTTESAMGRARAALQASPADLPAAKIAIDQMRAALAPFVENQAYTWFDAAAIILREGLEALLVIVALLAFLRRSGNESKRGWIWAGGGLGVLASVITALILQAIFSSVSAGVNREVIEGATGLIAAALLFYVSYWLHSKATLHAWKKYIDARTTQALARGSMLGLALLAFLAVFREGAETTVFYLGMAPSIALRDLLLGIGVGVVVLVVAAVLMLVVGVKLPLRPFFRVAGVLVYYLGFKFVGTGLHALQVAGVVPTAPIAGLSTNPVFAFFGIYPTWQTLLPQLALLLGALGAWLYLRAQDRRAQALSTSAAV